MYEKARTDTQFEFEHTTTKTIGIIFDAKKVIKVYYEWAEADLNIKSAYYKKTLINYIYFK